METGGNGDFQKKDYEDLKQCLLQNWGDVFRIQCKGFRLT